MFALGRVDDVAWQSDELERVLDDLAEFGAPAEVIEATRAEYGPQVAADFLVHPDNATAVRVLLASATQWRVASLSTMSSAAIVQTGLDYGVVETVARLEGLELELPSDFRRLRILEAGALKAWATERKARS